jgi:hypothetical protein
MFLVSSAKHPGGSRASPAGLQIQFPTSRELARPLPFLCFPPFASPKPLPAQIHRSLSNLPLPMEFFAATGEDEDSVDTSNLPVKQAFWELSPQASRSMGVPGAHLQRAAANFNSFDFNSEASNYVSGTIIRVPSRLLNLSW